MNLKEVGMSAALRWGAMSRAQKMTLIGSPLAATSVLTGATKCTIIDSDHVRYESQEHWDYAEPSGWDNYCASGLSICFGWEEPMNTHWVFVEIKQISANFAIVQSYWEYYNCGYFTGKPYCEESVSAPRG